MARIRGKKRKVVFELNINKCYICGKDLLSLKPFNRTIDHVVPVALGGNDMITNLAPACRGCNSKKQDNPRPHGARMLIAGFDYPLPLE